MSGFDLEDQGAVTVREDEGQVVHIRDARGDLAYTGEGEQRKPVTVRVAGTFSTHYRRANDAIQQRVLKRRQRDITPEQVLANRIELVRSCILDWQGFTNQGKPLVFSPENATLLLTKCPWVRAQLEEAMEDHAAFFGSASTS